MAESGSLPSPTATDRFRRLALPFIVGYHRLFINLASKALFEAESTAMVSPTSILDARPFSALRNPFRSTHCHPRTAEPSNRAWENLDSRHVGLRIVDSFDDRKSNQKFPNAGAPTVVFGSQLKIHTSPFPPPAPAPTLTHPPVKSSEPPRRMVSAGDMALSEDYTCVIAHGPNPRTTHIFDDCVIGSYDGSGACPETGKESGCWGGRSRFPVEDFLSFCHACKQPLGPGNDIYMYRGEKAFCSVECRSREMSMEEETGSDDSVSAAAFDR